MKSLVHIAVYNRPLFYKENDVIWVLGLIHFIKQIIKETRHVVVMYPGEIWEQERYKCKVTHSSSYLNHMHTSIVVTNPL